MNKTKYEALRELEEDIASVRKQPILSGKEKERLEKAERQVSRAAEEAEQSNTPEGEDPIQLFDEEYRAELHGRDLGLTLTEFELLQTLKQNRSKTFTRQQILEVVWRDSIMVTERTVDAHAKNLREKLGDYSDRIETVRGIGYRYKPKQND